MGERKGQNHYYPPDFDPAKHRSLNGYHGTHALRERARKMDKGIMIIRFEMPFNCWCLTCHKPIGMGVRYNAEKTKVGMYHSTPIFKFKMRCAMCAGDIEIQTDPQNFQYVIVSGARRKEQRWDVEDSGAVVVETRDTQKRLALDAMFNLEHSVEDRKKTADALPSLGRIEERREKLKDDFAMNQTVRHLFRTDKQARKRAAEADAAFLEKHSLQDGAVRLLPAAEKDERQASLMRLRTARAAPTEAEGEEDAEEAIFGALGPQPRKKRALGHLGIRLKPKKPREDVERKEEEEEKEEKEEEKKEEEKDEEEKKEEEKEEEKADGSENSCEDRVCSSGTAAGLLGLTAYSDSDSDMG